jgi:hypothetical protein
MMSMMMMYRDVDDIDADDEVYSIVFPIYVSEY